MADATRWVVVGGGSAGCVLAARLSERDDRHVVVVEGGADHPVSRPPDDVGPYLTDVSRLRADCEVVRRPGDQPVSYAQGWGLGGSSLVNGSVVVPGPGVAAGHLLPLEPPWAVGAVGRAVSTAATDAIELLQVRRDRVRVTTADAYLRPARRRPNLEVRTETPVARVAFDARRAIGVVTEGGDEIEADHVVVCAGAVATPTLLLRSGVDTPGVGAGLQDHPAVAIALDLADGTSDVVPAAAVSVERPGRQLMVLDRLPDGTGRAAIFAAVTRVASTGSVTLPDPDGPPLVELGLLTEPGDVAALTAAALEALDLVARPEVRDVVAAAHVDDHGTPAARLAGDPVAVGRWVTDRLGGYHHASASCRMGRVTDDRGAVRGYEGLVVCDASLFPGVPSANPYLSVVVLAERVAARW